MKKTILMMALALTGVLGMSAQDLQQKEQRPRFDRSEMMERRVNEMAERYNLSDAQKQKLMELNKRFADKMMPPRPRGGMNGGAQPGRGVRQGRPDGVTSASSQAQPRKDSDEAQRKKEMRATRKAYEKELKGILTPKQWKAYQKDRKNRSKRPLHRGENR